MDFKFCLLSAGHPGHLLALGGILHDAIFSNQKLPSLAVCIREDDVTAYIMRRSEQGGALFWETPFTSNFKTQISK